VTMKLTQTLASANSSTPDGVKPSPGRFAVILIWHVRRDIHALQSFFWILNHFRCFTHYFAEVAGALNAIKKEHQLHLEVWLESWFWDSGRGLSVGLVVKLFVPDLLTRLETDSARSGLGALLTQEPLDSAVSQKKSRVQEPEWLRTVWKNDVIIFSE
jgi:hypothetical protein